MSNSVPVAVSEAVGRFLKHIHTSSWSLWEYYSSNVKNVSPFNEQNAGTKLVLKSDIYARCLLKNLLKLYS